MVNYEIGNTKGFEVVHNSKEWRIAVHTYEKKVNGLEALQNWGIHETSEEAFVLMMGQAWLITAVEGKREDDFQIHPLQMHQVYLVEQGERHAILLKEDSSVLIMENLDMNKSRNESICESIVEAVRKVVDR
ncbi:MAG TPA: hypothetical protein IAC62_07430 [Candidatus Pelethocola excrementipullorum]|nr:hypothetical protein [Candidatus Pelethocola excrementipullorum]